MSEKRFVRYNARGLPIYEDSEGYKICVLDGCFKRSYNATLCWLHRRDGNDYTEYIESVKRPLNEYTLVNDEYYEMTVNNCDTVYKISKEDYEFAKAKNWWKDKGNRPYLMAKENGEHLKYHSTLLKDEIRSYSLEENVELDKVVVDHANGDSSDNRRSNLRLVTQSENNMNKIIQGNNTTGLAGIHWHSRDKIWTVYISVDNKRISLGRYYYLRNAVRARVDAEHKYFGEYALRLRDEEYNNKIAEYLSLPAVIEPVIRSRPNNEFGVLGISKDNKDRFIASFYHRKTKRNERKAFDTFDEAYQWRLKKEVEEFGVRILYKDEKKEKQI